MPDPQLRPDRPVRGHPVGPARVLALAYGFFTVAAGARSAVQLTVHPHRALFAYLLSALAAVIYCSAAVLLVAAERGHGEPGRRVRAAVWKLCLVELAGVMVVGTVSLAVPASFPDATVWSRFGSGYGYVPAVLPLLALWWLHREKRSFADIPDPDATRQHRDLIVMLDEGNRNE